MPPGAIRVDKLLWFLRFAKSRSLAQKWIKVGHLRKNGARVVRLDLPIVPGDVLTLPLQSKVLVIEILSLPARRGPAEEARSCYRELDAGRPIAIAGENIPDCEGHQHS